MEKIIYEWNDEKSEVVCTYSIGNKEYTGLAFCHPEEKEPNEEFGETLARLRAYSFYAQDMAHDTHEQLKVITEVCNALEGRHNFNPESIEYKIVRKKKWMITAEFLEWKSARKYLKKEIYNMIHADEVKAKELEYYEALKKRVAEKRNADSGE